MSDNTMNTNVTTEEVNLEEIFPAGADNVVIADESSKPKNIFSDLSSATPDMSFDTPVKKPVVEETTEAAEAPAAEAAPEEAPVAEASSEDVASIIDDLASENDELESSNETTSTETRGRKKISGISDVFSKLIKDDKIVPFDDDKPLEEYSAKDWEELIQANLEEKANEVRRETPKKFFDALPPELKVAARYVADGGQDLKGLFKTLSHVEESKELSLDKEKDQEKIITEYLSATGYGTQEEIADEIEIWKDLGKLQQQASKFKPKLDKMQEKIVAQKLQEQELKKKQQEKASKEYMSNVYETLKGGTVGDLKVDKKTQSMLFNGLVQPAYPSVNGNNTNLLGHLLEKYQFVEPNYDLITEALWLLSDPNGYKSKIMEKGAQKTVADTVRKLKTEQSNSGGNSLGVDQKERSSKPKRKIQRANNIFKRM
jgi:hypothetical protein